MRNHWHILALGSVLGAAGCYAEHASVQPDGQRKADKEGSSQPAMCADRLAQVGSTLERVLDAHAHCAMREDCTEVSIDTACLTQCAAVVGPGGEAAVRDAIEELNAGACREILEQGCEVPLAQCPAIALPVACVGSGNDAHCVWGDPHASEDAAVPPSPPPSSTCVSRAVSFHDDGGLAPSVDHFTVTPCRGFKITRRAQAVAGTDGSCENDIAQDAEYNVAALNDALAHPDVVAALEASPVVYGLDTRPWDGFVLHIEIDGDTIEVGSDCGAGSDCQLIPNGIAILRSTLEELGVQQRALDSCKVLQ